MFRNLFVMVMAVVGAAVMVRAAQQFAGQLADSTSYVGGLDPMAGLIIAPAVLIGALVGAVFGGLVFPTMR
jgi:hypothetical protein